MKKSLKLLCSTAVVVFFASLTTASRAAQILTVGSGWQYGQNSSRNAVQDNSPITFSITSGTKLFSFTDGFQAGDIFSLRFLVAPVSFTIPTVFSTFSTPFNNNLGPAQGFFASAWLNNSFSHGQVTLGPGNYSVFVRDQSNIAYPAGFGFRLDAVPEPEVWAFVLAGFCLAGSAIRRRSIVRVTYA